jgi:hypothetical protein
MATGPFNFSYTDQAVRESLLDIITNIDPMEDQLYVSLQKSTADQPLHQWLTDTLASVNNALVNNQSGGGLGSEGADVVFNSLTNPSRSTNWTQIVVSPFQVSGTDRASNTAGFKDRFAYEMQKAMKAWRRWAEFSLVRSTLVSGSATTGSANARTLAGIKAQITTNLTAQSGVSLSETMLNSYLQNAWAAGGVVDAVYVGGTLKRRISSFVNTNTRFVEADSESVNNVINIYESDFGRVEVDKHRYVTVSGDNNNDLIGIQKDKWAVAHLRGREPHYEDIAKTGDSTKGMIIGELTLEGRAQNSSFYTQALL